MKRLGGVAAMNRLLEALGSGKARILSQLDVEAQDRRWKRERKRDNRRKRAARIRRHGR